MAWNNNALKTFFNKYGDRINSISLNNGKYLLIGYQDGVQLKDIEFVTENGVDLIKVHHRKQQGGTILEWDDFITTEFIEGIDVLSEEHKDYRLDPFTLK